MISKLENMDYERDASRAVTWLACAALAVVLAICLLAAGGCALLDTVASDERVQAEFDRAVEALLAALESDGGTVETPPAVDPHAVDPPAADSPAVDPPAVATDAVPYSDLNWSHGGFNGSKAVLNPGAVIGNLSVSAGGLSFRWICGNCQTLGASSAGDADHTLACLFYRDAAGRWQGGKFDWISTSRTTRDFKNVDSGYRGWNTAAFRESKEVAFVVVGLNGRRSNVIIARK